MPTSRHMAHQTVPGHHQKLFHFLTTDTTSRNRDGAPGAGRMELRGLQIVPNVPSLMFLRSAAPGVVISADPPPRQTVNSMLPLIGPPGALDSSCADD